MTSRLLKKSLRTPVRPALARNRLIAFILAGMVAATWPYAARAADPDIATQPLSGIAAVGESFGFSVSATGSQPLSYQWKFNGSNLQDQTNSWFAITNLSTGNQGNYSVLVTNLLGSMVSSNAVLTITNLAPRALLNGTVTGGAQATVPVLLSANGRENRVVFTLAYDPTVFTNPTFFPSVTNDNADLDTSMTNLGLITGDLTLPQGQTFPAGLRTEIGQLHFDFLSTTNPLLGGIYFTNVSLTATNLAFDTNGFEMTLPGYILPQANVLSVSPTLDRQSGLFEQQVAVAYPGGLPLTNVTLLVSGPNRLVATNTLGFDTRTNAISVYNSPGQLLVGPNSNGLFIETPYLSAGDFLGGGSRVLTIEFYVSDHSTVPSPTYLLSSATTIAYTVPAAATPLNITTNRFLNGTFIIQWQSRMNYQYFVQYAPTVDDLMNSTTNSRVVIPSVLGTGYSMQWIDNGPPKTVSPPIEGSRFYRVLELPTK